MLHSRSNRNAEVVIYVQPSRFRKILSDIRALKGLEVEGFIDRICKEYNYFRFFSTDIGDNNHNYYTVVQVREYANEPYGKCAECDCNKRRFINGKTGVCFFKEYIRNNYTTKIPK